MANAMPFRFSTKYEDNETDLLYYGHRYYNASTGRWLSRDPIGERGGWNIYSFCRNDAVSQRDLLGLFSFEVEYHVNWPADSEIWPYPTTGALTRVLGRSYKPDRFREGNCVRYRIEAKAMYAIYYRQGVDPSDTKTASGMTLEMHEQMHVSAYNIPLIDFENAFNGYKICCTGKCIREFNDWTSAAFEVALNQGRHDSIEFDLSGEYSPNAPEIPDLQAALNAAVKSLADAKQKEKDAKKKFEGCVSSAIKK